MATVKSKRVSVALTPDIHDGAAVAAKSLGMSNNAWLGMAIGRAVRAHRLEAEVMERVLRETLGEQLAMQLEEMNMHGAQAT